MRFDAVITLLGRLFLRFGKGAFPIVVLAIYSLAVPDRRIFGSAAFEEVLDLSALALALLGLTLRASAINSSVATPQAAGHANGGASGFVRNPRYLGGLLVCLGIFLMHGAPYVVIVGTAVCLLIYGAIMRAEERDLRDGSAGKARAAYRTGGPANPAPGLRQTLLSEWPIVVGVFLALLLTEVHESLSASDAADLRLVLIVIAVGLVAFVLPPLVMRTARAHSGVESAGALADPVRAAIAGTRGILVNGRVGQVDRLENALSFGQQEAILKETLTAAKLAPGDFLVDIGCGTGKLAVAAAAINGGDNRVLGIDATPGIIDLAIQRAREAGVHAEFQVGIAEALPLADRAANAVTSSYFFHHLPSDVKPQALREMWRVLAPGGRLIITDYSRARGLYGLILSIPMRANFYEYVRPQLRGELEDIIASEKLGALEVVSVFLGYITVMRIVKPA